MTGFFENLSDSVRRYREKSRRDFYADPTRTRRKNIGISAATFNLLLAFGFGRNLYEYLAADPRPADARLAVICAFGLTLSLCAIAIGFLIQFIAARHRSWLFTLTTIGLTAVSVTLIMMASETVS